MGFILTNRGMGIHDEGSLDCHVGWCSYTSDATPVPRLHDGCPNGGTLHGEFDHGEPVAGSQDVSAGHWVVYEGCDACPLRQMIRHDAAVDVQVLDVITPAAVPAKKAAKRVRKSAKK